MAAGTVSPEHDRPSPARATSAARASGPPAPAAPRDRRAPARSSRRSAEQEADEKDRVGKPHDRRQQQEEDRLHRPRRRETAAPPPKARRNDGRVSTSITVAIFGANHITSTISEQRAAGIGADEGRRRAGRRQRQRADHQQPDPGRRAEEHQDREHELIAADGLEAGQQQEMPILHVALAPAQVAADELDQRRRVLLEARAFLRQHAHLVAGAPHQHRLDLVVAEHMAVDQRTAGEHRQFAMRHERLRAG